VIWDMLVCCIENSQLTQTVEPVSIVLGLKHSQVMIMASHETERRRIAKTWALTYALVCADKEEATNVIELLSHSGTIRLMENYMRALFNTLISIDADNGIIFSTTATSGLSSDSTESEETIIQRYIPYGNLVLIAILSCCCVFFLHRYRNQRSKSKPVSIVPMELQLSQIPTRLDTDESLSLYDEQIAYPTELQGELSLA